jgi:hypothetical protein
VAVVGTPGTPDYERQFRAWSNTWQAAANKAAAEFIPIGLDANPGIPDRERLKATIREESTSSSEPFWLVLIGHGTYDGHDAKLNLRGPDLTDRELAEWLSSASRPLVILDCTSSSSPFLNRLSKAGRVVVTATKSGHEQNFARFGEYLAESIADPRADLDKDGQVSVLEAFLTAHGRVEEWYRTRGQLATEHALLDDNGDALGTPADWFHGVRATRRAKDGASADGLRSHQIHLVPSERERRLSPEVRKHRDELELALAALRDRKEKLGEETYYERLEGLLVELARLYRQATDP